MSYNEKRISFHSFIQVYVYICVLSLCVTLAFYFFCVFFLLLTLFSSSFLSVSMRMNILPIICAFKRIYNAKFENLSKEMLNEGEKRVRKKKAQKISEKQAGRQIGSNMNQFDFYSNRSRAKWQTESIYIYVCYLCAVESCLCHTLE